MEIYYIEDDADVAALVEEYLAQQGFSVTVLPGVGAAEQALLARRPALALVDWNLPDGTGAELCRWARSRWPSLPLVLLTVRDDTADIVAGLDAGADDYIAKPFALEVLRSRIGALLRRAGGGMDACLVCDDIRLEEAGMRVFRAGAEVPLSQTEYQLLLTLLRNKGRNVTREQLLRRLWDENGSYVNDNTLTVTVKRLREKLGRPACLKTVRSFGYRMEDTI